MRKQLKKAGSDGLMIYFTKEESRLYGLLEGSVIDLDDMVIINAKGDEGDGKKDN